MKKRAIVASGEKLDTSEVKPDKSYKQKKMLLFKTNPRCGCFISTIISRRA